MKAVLLAGGKGTRLKPYTTSFPKPLMPVGDKPIMEMVIEQLAKAGFDELIIAVGHLAELITTFFGDGSKYGVKITYFREDEPLGTAGCLRELKGQLTETFLMMNGDILSDIDLLKALEHHRDNEATATVALVPRKQAIDYGTVELDDSGAIKKWVEKPSLDLLVSTGIYILEPEAIEHIPDDGRFDFPDLAVKLMDAGMRVQGYKHHGYWLDIGRPDDYARACEDVTRLFGDAE